MAPLNQYYPQSVSHPGSTLQDILEEREMGSKELAVRTGKPEKTISDVLNGKSSITPEMAILFEQVLKVPGQFWLNRQKTYDEYLARLDYQSTIEEGLEWAKSFPYSQMAKFNWVESTSRIQEKVVNLFEFFGVSSSKGYYDFYHNQKLLVNFRISLKNNENSGAIAAWLRRGEIQANEFEVREFDKAGLKEAISALKRIMAENPVDFFDRIQEVCSNVGVKVVHTPCLPKAPIHGSTRWINNTPLVQMSGRYRRNDIFWFTFFHEIGHILLHGKKYISIENIDYDGENQDYEDEADAFSANILLTEKEEREILSNHDLDSDDVIHYAEKFGIHPAIIIGRLQHKGLVPFGLGNHFFEAISL